MSDKDGDVTQDDDDDENAPKREANGSGAVEAHARDKDPPHEILEKGIVYFFFRARVNIEDPHDVQDIARTYLILRPIPKDSKISHGPIQDEGNCRLIAIPKKTLPQSGRDRWIAFVEKGATSFEDLKKEFLASNEYNTKTMGPRKSPAATPIGEGVYAITSTGRENHLAYMLTLPERPGEVQKEIGLDRQGSFIISTKNPKFPGPRNAQLPDDPEFSQEIIDEFNNLRWSPTGPKHLDFPNAQFLLVGESGGLESAMDTSNTGKRKRGNKEAEPEEEIKKLEEEDKRRTKELGGKDAIFADLKLQAKDYPKLKTTF